MKELARPLEDDWQATLAAVARAHGWPAAADVAKLGAAVRAMSEAYNEGDTKAAAAAPLAARLGFGFARDVPKCAAAVRELVAAGALALPKDRALRVLDVGAGMGATTWGLARALDAAGMEGAIDATWIDRDAAALAVGAEIVRARGAAGRVKLAVKTEMRGAGRGEGAARGSFDVVLLGQVLSELDPGLDLAARTQKHVALVTEHLALLAEGGSLVIVEPALRERTRHLHRVRDALLAARACTLFAPCLHAAACPALAVEGDWCHEDRAVDLPPWLVPVARAAGLRWQGLTFSFLALRRDDRTLIGSLAPGGARLRVVSGAIVTKGKSERYLCGENPDSAHPGRVRVTRLDREAWEPNAAWDGLARGDVLTVDPPLNPAKARVMSETRVDLSKLETH